MWGSYHNHDHIDVVLIDYTNHRGERAIRRIRPIGLHFEKNDFHNGVQWLLHAMDLDKEVPRVFAMVNIHAWKPAP